MRYVKASNPKECPKCKRVYNFKQHEYCTQSRCFSKLTELKKKGNFFFKIYEKDSVLDHPLIAAEHTSTIDSRERTLIEDTFELHEPGTINAIVCTPTMELGVDIGNLPFVLLRNVPPSSSSYAQRAGRAGRDQNNSLVLTFCNYNLYSHSGAHDNFFYHHPEKIVSGLIVPPRFSLDSRKIMRMHIHGIVMRYVSQGISGQLSEMIDFSNKPLFPINSSRLQQIKTVITQKYNEIHDMVKQVYDHQKFVHNYPWFTDDFIKEQIMGFPENLQKVFDIVREEFINLTNEKEELRKEFDEKGATIGSLLHSRIKQIQLILDEIQNKDQDPFEKKSTYSRYNTWNYLRNHGFIPNYGFPEQNIKVQLWNRNPNERPIDNFRNPVVALREFAPLAQMYVKGMVYLVNYADYRYKNNLVQRSLYVCDNCNFIKHDIQAEAIASYQICENCGNPTCAENFKDALEFPSMRGYTREAITSQAENRSPGFYEVIYNYHESKYVKHYEIKTVSNELLGMIHYDSQGEVFALNKGRFDFQAQHFETFNICLNCQKWMTPEEVSDERLSKHISTNSLTDVFKKGCKTSDIQKDLWLFLSNHYNLLSIEIPRSQVLSILSNAQKSSPELSSIDLQDSNTLENFYYTLKNLMQQTLEHIFCLSESDLMSFIMVGQNEEYKIIIYETEEGGSGYLKLLSTEFQWYLLLMSRLPELVHFVVENGKILDIYENSHPKGCQDACYECLKNYRNQYDHEKLNRYIVRPFLEKLLQSNLYLKETAIEQQIFLDEEFDSDLERLFLRKLTELNIPHPNKAKVLITDTDSQIPLTNVDFFYEPKLCVYIDGPPHDPDKYPDQAKKDEDISLDLDLMGYNVVRIKLYNSDSYEQDFKAQLPKLKEKIERL